MKTNVKSLKEYRAYVFTFIFKQALIPYTP